jgi:uncharacterized protein with GYD domain
MATCVALIQFTDQGIRNIKETVNRGDSAIPDAEKLGVQAWNNSGQWAPTTL